MGVANMPLIISECLPISYEYFDILCFRHYGHQDNQVLQEEMQHDTRLLEEREQHMRQLEVTVCVLCVNGYWSSLCNGISL